MAGKPFSIDRLFTPAEDWTIQFDGDNQVIIIDDFYEDPDAIYDWLMGQDYPLWKYSTEAQTQNGKVYNDCRTTLAVSHPTRMWHMNIFRLQQICAHHWWKPGYDTAQRFEFNIFQTIEEFDNKYQHYPHVDSPLTQADEASTINVLWYLDKEESGGTAVYNGEWITNDERHNLLYPVEEKFDVAHIIPAKFNRCVMFPGNRLHGAWIDDYTKYSGDKWRISQVQFFHPNNSTQHTRLNKHQDQQEIGM